MLGKINIRIQYQKLYHCINSERLNKENMGWVRLTVYMKRDTHKTDLLKAVFSSVFTDRLLRDGVQARWEQPANGWRLVRDYFHKLNLCKAMELHSLHLRLLRELTNVHVRSASGIFETLWMWSRGDFQQLEKGKYHTCLQKGEEGWSWELHAHGRLTLLPRDNHDLCTLRPHLWVHKREEGDGTVKHCWTRVTGRGWMRWGPGQLFTAVPGCM